MSPVHSLELTNPVIARQSAFIAKGVRFVTTPSDIGFLMAAAGQRTAQIRQGVAK